MATYNKTGTTVTSGVPTIDDRGAYRGSNSVIVISGKYDFSALNSSGNTLVTADIFQCLAIPANSLIRAAVIEITQAAVGTTCTIDVGTGGGAGHATGVNGKTVQVNAPTLIGVAEASVNSVHVATADTLDVTFTTVTSITAGPKFKLSLEIVDMNGPA